MKVSWAAPLVNAAVLAREYGLRGRPVRHFLLQYLDISLPECLLHHRTGEPACHHRRHPIPGGLCQSLTDCRLYDIFDHFPSMIDRPL